MRIEHIKLTHFKNHKEIQFDFKSAFNCFVGLNGKGKTNVLDAIYFVCVTKSKFNASDSQLIHHGENFFRIEAKFKDNIHLIAKYQKGKKVFEVNQVSYDKLSDHFGKFPVIMACPDDILLMIGGSEERRKFLDFTLSTLDHSYFENLVKYNHFLEQKSALLKSSKNQVDLALLEQYNLKLVEFGTPIYHKRKSNIDLLSNFINELYSVISDNQESILVKYDSEVDIDSYHEQLNACREKELITQRCVLGIHKDDLLFLTNTFVTKKFASQGQQKSFLYALRLAQYKMVFRAIGEKPILLIDDIFDKLDTKRSENLIAVLRDKQEYDQVFITDTDKHKLELYLKDQEYTIREL